MRIRVRVKPVLEFTSRFVHSLFRCPQGSPLGVNEEEYPGRPTFTSVQSRLLVKLASAAGPGHIFRRICFGRPVGYPILEGTTFVFF